MLRLPLGGADRVKVRTSAGQSATAARHALHREARLLSIVDDAVLIIDLNGVTVECNSAAEQLFGQPRSALIGSGPQPMPDPVAGRQLFAGMLGAVRAGTQWRDEASFTFNGRLRWVAMRAIGLWDDNGELVGVAVVNRDLTAEQERARALGEAEEQWRLTFTGAPAGMALVAPDGQFMRANPALCRMLGRTEAEVLAVTFQDITHPDDLDADLDLFADLSAGRIQDYSLDKRYRHADGHWIWITLSVGAVRDTSTGEPVHFVSQMLDVTERRRAADRLASIIASAGDAFVAINRSGQVSQWNAAAERLFGWTAQEATGQSMGQLIVPPEMREAHDNGLARVIAGGEPHIMNRRVELTACRRDGSRVPIELTVWQPDDGTEFYAFVHDNSERVQAATEQATASAASAASVLRQASIVDAQLAIADVDLSPQKVMRAVCEHAQRLTGAHGAVIEIREDEDLVYRATTGTAQPFLGMRLAVEGSVSGLSVTSGLALSCTDTDTDVRVNRDACRKVGIRSMLVVPLRRGGEVLGVLKVTGEDAGHFGPEHLATLELLAAPFGAALANAWRLESTNQQAMTDIVTGLPNRLAARRELERALGRQARNGGHTAVLFCDLDRFKQVNDTFGHGVGDELLRAVADRLRIAVRTTDLPARYGGDEFIVVCENLTNPDDVDILAHRILNAVPAPYQLGGSDVAIGVSVGVAVADELVSVERLLCAADEAMYEAKAAGGNSNRIRHLT